MNQTTTYERLGSEDVVVQLTKNANGDTLRTQSFTKAQITAQRAAAVTQNTAALARFDEMLGLLD